jgi:uncharacterized protein YkwD
MQRAFPIENRRGCPVPRTGLPGAAVDSDVRSTPLPPRRRSFGLAVPARLALLAGLAILTAAAPPAVADPPAATDSEALRRDLLRLLNADRAAAGAPPLRRSPPLDRAAQQQIEEVAASGSLSGERRPEDAMSQRLAEAGYEARQWADNLISGPRSAAELVAAWRRDDRDGTYQRLLEPAYSDLGVGIARLDGQPAWSILFAIPQREAFARETAALHDLARVRSDVVERVNAERRRAGEPPLTLNPRLELAAQRHAEDMLARSFFGHRGSDGGTVRERAKAAGYSWHMVGENLAEGQDSVKEAVEAWMHSPSHRENILNRGFRETGVGLAMGRDPGSGEYRILWVQTFGLPR